MSILNGFNYVVFADQSSNSSQYVSIFKYIHRESWMKPGGTFRWPMMGEANTLNPFTFTTSWEFMIIDSVYDTLVEVTPDLKYAGRLAESWSVSPDGKVWTFKLFPNAAWHDGKPITAEDVAFTYNLMRDIGNKTRFSDTAVLIDKAVAVDDHTVKIFLKKPYAPFLYMMASEYYIVPEHIWSKINKTDILKFKNDNPVGSGPFIFVEHKPQQYYKLKANPNYHLGRPLIDTIVMPIISNPDAMLLAFKRGEVDVMTWTVPYNSIPQLKGLPNVHIHAVTEFGARFMYFNCRRWPMNLTKFRLAVHYAINLTEVANIIYQGYAAYKRGGKFDSAMVSTIMFIRSMPSFWLGLVLLITFGYYLGIAPLYGAYTYGATYSNILEFMEDVLGHLWLPMLTLTLLYTTGYFMIMRNNMIDIMGEDFINVAKAKGLPDRAVVFKHALRPASLPVITALALDLGWSIGGALLIEIVFSLPGVGKLLYDAVYMTDYPLLLGIVVYTSALTLTLVTSAEILYAYVDPRVRLR